MGWLAGWVGGFLQKIMPLYLDYRMGFQDRSSVAKKEKTPIRRSRGRKKHTIVCSVLVSGRVWGISAGKKKLSILLKLSSHPTQYLTLSHNKLVPMYAPFLCFTQKSCPNFNLNNWFVKKFVLNVPPGVYIPAV